jgi:hypothetical protein
LIETARGADARFELGQPTRSYFSFQRFIHFFRPFGGTTSFRVVVGPAIDADEEISVALQELRVGCAASSVNATELKKMTDHYFMGSDIATDRRPGSEVALNIKCLTL